MRWLWLLVLALMAPLALAAIDTYEFDTEEQRQRFYQLSSELRCPKCQNQNIADSDAPIAMDLRREVYRMLNEGKDNEEIVDFLVARYGEFVRYKPALTPATAILWFGPAAMLLAGFIVLLVMLRRRQKALREAAGKSLSQDEQRRLQSLLEREEDS
ncbi:MULTISPECIES: cytochrome c-type biogenesis protein [Halopseudomonas]|jgi:cytochrome c-type biogenesis protein CcmH|uniref:Cytochrome c-type biogenesis protein n=1 Tax=Halopseudomonas formosensis TaxID=1002526 RepID=A0A1I6BHN6_9GAMM|nr:cytochrome c-type biogenesis protein [Halopseudomonas formosensis]MDX9686689.1 cytochrome c-type biogenesis protein CcmH [Halopseudomonas formosensis]MDY3198333.1 cytochrome c-type biogenesis protein CcmH [Pseudomonadaceae bacterium]NLB99757.1 cytochrome c-type biogenesis protein CcmH [Halopseudomonas formosensis]SFQ80462.1 cytochrome c-type biogenesis protein CcmH [Halopseudomonas formosensis]